MTEYDNVEYGIIENVIENQISATTPGLVEPQEGCPATNLFIELKPNPKYNTLGNLSAGVFHTLVYFRVRSEHIGKTALLRQSKKNLEKGLVQIIQTLEIEGGPQLGGQIKYYPNPARLSRHENRN